MPPTIDTQFELAFEPLAREGSRLAFPCDGRGEVALDTLSEACRNDYFFARKVIGAAFHAPRVVARVCRAAP